MSQQVALAARQFQHQREPLLAMRAEQDNMGDFNRGAGWDLAPSIVGFLFDGGLDGAFEREVVSQRRVAHDNEWMN